MSPTFLLQIREEFYTTPLSIDELCLKYNVEELPGSERWIKPDEFSHLESSDEEGESDEAEEEKLDPEQAALKKNLISQARTIMRKCNTMLMRVDNARDLKDIATVHKDIYTAHFGKVVAQKASSDEDEFSTTLKTLMEKYSE